MADFKKAGGGEKDFTAQLVFLLLGLFLASVILSQIINGLNYWFGDLDQSPWFLALMRFISWSIPIIRAGAILVCVASVIMIAYYNSKLKALNIAEKKIYKAYDPKADSSPESVTEQKVKNTKWDKVQKLINSSNSSDWRQAIIEADILLDEVLRDLGYLGDSVGDMLKSVDKSDFRSLESAWEAHKIRNRIAHSGTEFPLSEREAKRAISLFEQVFREFDLV